MMKWIAELAVGYLLAGMLMAFLTRLALRAMKLDPDNPWNSDNFLWCMWHEPYAMVVFWPLLAVFGALAGIVMVAGRLAIALADMVSGK